MKRSWRTNWRTLRYALPMLLVAVGCGKGVDSTSTTAAAAGGAAPAAVAAAAAPATSAPAASAPASSPTITSGAVSPPPATPAAPPASDLPSPEAIRKKNEIEWALKLDEIKNDPNGQWASEARASSAYQDADGSAPYSATQAGGPPNVETYGSNNAAWTPKSADAGIEWLELRYAKAVYATAVRIRESNGPGAIIKVEVFDEQGAAHTVWSGSDGTKGLDFLIVEFPRTTFKTARIKMTLATNVVPGWNAIDAVQLVGTEQ